MYSSYNSFTQNINRDAMVVTTLDTFTSLLAGTTIFGILGNLAYEMDDDVENVIGGGGTGLAFISYPDAIAKFDAVPWVINVYKLEVFCICMFSVLVIRYFIFLHALRTGCGKLGCVTRMCKCGYFGCLPIHKASICVHRNRHSRFPLRISLRYSGKH